MRIGLVLLLSVMMAATLPGPSYGEANSPGDVVKTVYTLANQGRYDEVLKYWAQDFQFAMERCLGVITGGTKELLDKATKKGTIDQILITREEVLGKKARVHYLLRYRDGSEKVSVEDMVFEDKMWKVTFKVLRQ